ncbi:MAG TPA: ferredoxin reductase [Solirubrobacteraceae bacterium]
MWRTATVREVIAESRSARTLALDVPGWPGHRAGQHLDLRLTAEDGYQAQRSYSVASAPELERLEITVEVVEDGEVSPYLAAEVRPGDQFEVRGPIGGHFTWSADEGGPVLLVAGGSGLVPLMAMLRHRAARASDAAMNVLISARSPEEALYRAELAELEGAAGLEVIWTWTRSAPQDWTGARGRVDGPLLEAAGFGDPSAVRCFACGPTPFVEHVLDLLVAGGYATAQIHAERFGPTGT